MDGKKIVSKGKGLQRKKKTIKKWAEITSSENEDANAENDESNTYYVFVVKKNTLYHQEMMDA